MPRLRLLLTVFAISALVSAQSPCTASVGSRIPFTIESTFQSTHYVGAPAVTPGAGSAIMIDVNCATSIDITGVGVNVYDAYASGLYTNTTQLELYSCPGTAVGNETNPAAWTLLGTAPLLMNQTPPSPAVFTTPITLPAGPHGLLMHVMPYNNFYVPILVTAVATVPVPLDYHDQFLDLTGLGFTRDLWAAGVGRGTYVPDFNISYTVSNSSARSNQYGSGCYFLPFSFYQDFTVPPGAFDLSNTSMLMLWSGSAYTVIGTPLSTWFTPGTGATGSSVITATPPAITSTASWDDGLSAPITLPFSINAPGGVTTNAIVVSSNGFIYLDPALVTAATQAYAYYGGIGGVLGGPPRLAPYFGDQDPSAPGGAMYYDIDPSGTTVYITWLAPEWGQPAATAAVQLVLSASSDVEFRYQSCTIAVAPVFVGYSPGNGATDPGSIDLSASFPLTTGDGSTPLSLRMDARPVLGTTTHLVTTNVHADNNNPNSPVPCLALMSLGAQNPGIGLAPFGAPGCSLYLPLSSATVPVGLLLPFPGQPAPLNLTVPINPTLVGVTAFAQTAAFTPLYNAAGFWTSNGVCIVLGN